MDVNDSPSATLLIFMNLFRRKMQNDEDYAAFVLFVWFTMVLPY